MDGVRMAVLSSRLEAVVAQHDEHAVPHRALRRAQHRARLLLLPGHRRRRARHGRREPADPRDERAGPDGARDQVRRTQSCGAATRSCTTRPTTATRTPPTTAILVPVVDDDGVHRFTVLAKAHQADCGNSQPTTYMADARDVYEEGALIFPASRSRQDYGDNDDIIRMCSCASASRTSGGATTWRCSARCGSASGACSSSGDEIGWDALDAFARRLVRLQRGGGWATAMPAPAGGRVDQPRTTRSPGAPEGIADQRATVDVRPGGARSSRSTCATTPTACRTASTSPRRPRRTAAMIGVFNSIEHGRAAQRRQLPAARGPAARELRGRHPAPPGELLGGHDQPRRPRRQRGAARASPSSADGYRPGRVRARDPGRRRRSSPAAIRATAASRSSTSSSSAQHRRRRQPGLRRLAHHRPRRATPACCVATASRSTSCATPCGCGRSA